MLCIRFVLKFEDVGGIWKMDDEEFYLGNV